MSFSTVGAMYIPMVTGRDAPIVACPICNALFSDCDWQASFSRNTAKTKEHYDVQVSLQKMVLKADWRKLGVMDVMRPVLR